MMGIRILCRIIFASLIDYFSFVLGFVYLGMVGSR